MSYTNVELVKGYLVDSFPRQDAIYDQPVVINSSDAISFFSGAVDDATVKVKSVQSNILTRITLILDSSTTSITASRIVPGSVVAATDSSMGKLYIENADFVIDYSLGDLTIKSGGELSTGMTVTVWYQTYYTYIAATDYSIDADNGEIRRLASGNIALGEVVYIDYNPVGKTYNEAVITNAVIMANGLVEREVDPSGDFGADPTLAASATFRALEIICESSAVRDLSRLNGQQNTTSGWLKLAEMFAARADGLLRSFRPPITGPNSPQHG